MEEYILFGFEDEMEKIALANAEQKKYEDFIRRFNAKETSFKKIAPSTMARIGIPGAIIAGHLFWKHRNKDYLKKIPDANLTRGYKSVKKYEKGDKEALNRAV